MKSSRNWCVSWRKSDPAAWPEVYTSLATGVVEGTKNGITDIMNMKFRKPASKYMTLDGHAYMGALWWYSDVAWKTLPDDLGRRLSLTA
ncbi:MAG: hypothetical protein R3D29_15895 [Nitratireductor sp.]